MMFGEASKDIRYLEPCPHCGREPDECICFDTEGLDEALRDLQSIDEWDEEEEGESYGPRT